MTGDEFQFDVFRTLSVDPKNINSLLTNGALGLCGEAGEVADQIKKVFFQGHAFDPVKIADELGDCFFYGAVLAKALGYTIEEIYELNVNKRKRRYPNGFDAERSIHRSQYESEGKPLG